VLKNHNDHCEACCGTGGSNVTAEVKVRTDNALKQLMKNNEMMINFILLRANNTNHEPKVISVVFDFNKSLPRFTRKINNNGTLDCIG